MNPVSNIIHKAFNQNKLNCLVGPTHEAFESMLAKTGHNFYAFQHKSFKKWVNTFRPPPENYFILPEGTLPSHIKFDVALSQNKFGQFQVLSELSHKLHIPLISLEHTLPMPGWPPNYLEQTGQMRGNWNVFITDMQIPAWKWQDKDDTQVITHAVDVDTFKPRGDTPLTPPRLNIILTVANDYIGRDWCLNFSQYKKVTEGLPTLPVGDTQGLSRAASDLAELVSFYQTSRIFLNTAHVSPVPMALIEASACGCAVVSVRASAIPEFVQHGVTGFLYETDEEARYYLELLLKDKDLATELGTNAVEYMRYKCNLERFLHEWNEIFEKSRNMYYKG